jgi:hypothetical protein
LAKKRKQITKKKRERDTFITTKKGKMRREKKKRIKRLKKGRKGERR